MAEVPTAFPATHPARMKLEPYSAEIRLSTLALGIDNIHFDVFLSPRFVEQARRFLLDLVRQRVNITLFYGVGVKAVGHPEFAAFRKQLSELLQGSLTRAKFEKNIEIDLLLRLALLKFLLQEIGNQFSSLIVECKDRIRARGQAFEHSEQAHLMRARIAEIQGDRKNVHRRVGQTLCQTFKELESSILTKSRRALFGEDFAETYELLTNRLLFVEGGNDESLFLEHYVLLGNFSSDLDRFDVFDALLLDFVQGFVLPDPQAEELGKVRKSHDRLVEQARTLRSELARLEEEQEDLLRRAGRSEELLAWLWKGRSADPAGSEAEFSELKERQKALEQKLAELGPQIEAEKQRTEFLMEECQSQLGGYLNRPENARRLFDSETPPAAGENSIELRSRLLEDWVNRLEERELLVHMLASYELRNLYREYCPPVHLQQLKKALVSHAEAKRVEQILQQFPARNFSMKRLEESARALRRYRRDEARGVALRFTEDFMRLRRDRRNYQHVAAWMEKINLVRSEHSRVLSQLNRSLYEFILPDEARPEQDPVISHAVIKADVRGSTRITKDLLSRGLNPASHFSLHLYQPVKRLLGRYGAAKVFTEGDAIILAVYETESNRANQRSVAKACVLAREILEVTRTYNAREETADLPRLELGVGVAFQDSAPSIWMDGDSRIMISRAINLSDRLSSCSRVARRLFANNSSPFNVFLLQTVMEGSAEEETEELVLRYNLNGIELSEEGFAKLTAELSLAPIEAGFAMPWGADRVELYLGQVPLGDALEPLVIRKAVARELLPAGLIGGPATRVYFEVCTDPKLLALVANPSSAASLKS